MMAIQPASETLGAKLSAFRRARGLSTAALARKAGVTTVSIWNWETNRRTPQGEYLEKLATALNVTVQQLQSKWGSDRCPLCGNEHFDPSLFLELHKAAK